MTPPAPPPIAFSTRLGTLSAGIVFMYLSNRVFDYLLYPYVIYRAGFFVGGMVMTALSALACLALLKYYDRSKRDWLGIETIRDLKDYNGKGFAARLAAWLLRRSDPIVFLALSLYYDPFITTVWLRHDRYGGMNPHDRRIFWGSVLVGNAFWTVSCWLGVNMLAWAWKRL